MSALKCCSLNAEEAETAAAHPVPFEEVFEIFDYSTGVSRHIAHVHLVPRIVALDPGRLLASLGDHLGHVALSSRAPGLCAEALALGIPPHSLKERKGRRRKKKE